MKGSREDLVGEGQLPYLSSTGVLLCLHPPGRGLGAAHGHTFRPPWVLFFFSGCHPPVGGPGPVVLLAEISARSQVERLETVWENSKYRKVPKCSLKFDVANPEL